MRRGIRSSLTGQRFTPEGGGQYADRGHLNQICVTDVQEKDGKIYHKTKYAIEPGTCVEGEIELGGTFYEDAAAFRRAYRIRACA